MGKDTFYSLTLHTVDSSIQPKVHAAVKVQNSKFHTAIQKKSSMIS